MNVAELTAHLDITGLVEFTRGMAQADASVERLRKDLRGLTTDALAARAALAGLGVDAGSVATVTALKDEVKGVRAPAAEASAAMKEMNPPASAIPELAAIKSEVKGIRDAALQADVAMSGLGGGSAGGPRTNRAVLDYVEQQNAAQIRQIYNQGVRSQFLDTEAQRRAAEAAALTGINPLDAHLVADAAARRNASELLRLRMQSGEGTYLSTLGSRENPFVMPAAARAASGIPGTDLRQAALVEERSRLMGLIPSEDIRSATNRIKADTESNGLFGFLFGAREATRLANGGGGGGSGGGAGGFLAGILPGGRRAGAAAVTTAVGLGIAAGPAILPAVAGAAPVLGAGLTTLIGAAGTLKLAFADLSAAAFTNRNAFLALTPVQQQFVQSLRSLDAGLGKTLEGIAQRTLLPQLTSALHAALTPASVSALQGGVGAFGNAIGGGAQQLGHLFGSSGFAQQFGTMMQQDAGYLRTFLDVFTRLTDGFVRFQVAAGPFLTWVGKVSLGFAAWADNAIRADAANGRLAHFFDIVKVSLQTVGNLLASVGHLAMGFFDAVGFKNSVALVNLLTNAINSLAGLLRANAGVLSAFFGGAVKAAGDILAVVKALLASFKPLLDTLRTLNSTVQTLTGGFSAFRGILDAVAAIFVVKMIPGLLGMKAAATTASEVAAGQMTLFNKATFTAVGTVSKLRLALLALLAIPPLFHGISNIWSQIFGSSATTGLSSAGDLLPVKRNGVWVDPNTGVPLSPAGQAFNNADAAGLSSVWGNPTAAAINTAAARARGGFTPTTGPSAAFATPPPFGSSGTGFTVPNVPYLRNLALAQAQNSTRGTIAALRAVIAYLWRVEPGLSPANQTTALTDITSYQSQLNSLLGTGASRSGVGFLTQGMQARLAAAQQGAAGISASTDPTTTTIRALNGLLVQTLAAYKVLKTALDDNTYAGKQLTAARAEANTLHKQAVAAQKAISQQRATLAEAHILGIGPGAGMVGAARETQTVRNFLNATLKQFGLAQTGSAPLGPFVTELYKLHDINKRQYESLEKILKVIEVAKEHTGKIASSITGNISQRLQEIKQELASQTGFTLTGAQHSVRAILGRYGADIPGSVLERLQYAQAHHGTVLTNRGAALGVPLTRGGAPSLSHVHVTVDVKGNTTIDRDNARIIAAEIANNLRRKNQRNSVQMTGANAGVNMGL